jgi:hypothetical protein
LLAFAFGIESKHSGYALQSFLWCGNLGRMKDDALRGALIAWAQLPSEIARDYAEALQLSMALYARIVAYGLFASLSSATSNNVIPDATLLGDVLASMRRDSTVTEAVAQYLFYFEDFNGQLGKGVAHADRLLGAAGRMVL